MPVAKLVKASGLYPEDTKVRPLPGIPQTKESDMGMSLKKAKKRLEARINDYEKNLANGGTGYRTPGSMKK